jgi:hypothetical protein
MPVALSAPTKAVFFQSPYRTAATQRWPYGETAEARRKEGAGTCLAPFYLPAAEAVTVLNCLTGDTAVRQFDLAAMSVSLWLLASMVIDVLTPKELTVYMIGAATAPAIFILAVLYWKQFPKLDLMISFGVLWMITGIALELITPKPLSQLTTVIALAPLMVIGAAINFQRWRRSRPNVRFDAAD